MMNKMSHIFHKHKIISTISCMIGFRALIRRLALKQPLHSHPPHPLPVTSRGCPCLQLSLTSTVQRATPEICTGASAHPQ